MTAPKPPQPEAAETAGASMAWPSERVVAADKIGAATLREARKAPWVTACVAIVVIAGLVVYYIPPIRSASSEVGNAAETWSASDQRRYETENDRRLAGMDRVIAQNASTIDALSALILKQEAKMDRLTDIVDELRRQVKAWENDRESRFEPRKDK